MGGTTRLGPYRTAAVYFKEGGREVGCLGLMGQNRKDLISGFFRLYNQEREDDSC